jgi:hypothetical protein
MLLQKLVRCIAQLYHNGIEKVGCTSKLVHKILIQLHHTPHQRLFHPTMFARIGEGLASHSLLNRQCIEVDEVQHQHKGCDLLVISAPNRVHTCSLSSEDAAAMTRAPKTFFASSTAARPTPPPAPMTRTVSPAIATTNQLKLNIYINRASPSTISKIHQSRLVSIAHGP